ncbi:hypothetical protein BC938DRAFT_473913 [Jimgerdemannia flammicorona]|uniref:Growth factor receptor domain-containing protein n=1 Tax=Jimgerdemannia flammicorona TaxID=994334 RepID=A0A433Q376_9FUNG|nr:hypothetical protein BC938DRAFT_473913 [Jimgerdemannia flammicorona]
MAHALARPGSQDPRADSARQDFSDQIANPAPQNAPQTSPAATTACPARASVSANQDTFTRTRGPETSLAMDACMGIGARIAQIRLPASVTRAKWGACPLGCSGCDESNKCTGCIPSWDSDGAGGCRLHTCPDGSSPPANNTCKSGECTCMGPWGPGAEKRSLHFHACYFQRSKKILLPIPGCAAECALCWGPTDGQCIACNPPWYLMDGFCVNYVSSTGQCTAPLSLTGSWYGIPNKTECGACATPCANCNSLNQTRSGGPICTECAAGWFVQDGECVEQCSDGYYDAGDATCKPCHPDCLTCSGPAFNQCRTCGSARPFLAQNGQCVEVCPKGTYQTNNGTCEACDSSCSSCFGGTSSQCLGCRDPTNVVFQGSCRTCSANTPLVPASHSCDDYVPVHASVLDQSDPNSTSTTNSLAIGFSIGAALLLLLILALVLHRRIMRRRRREATAAFAENAGFRGQREEANQLQKDTETMESIATDITRTLGETNGGTSSPASRSSFPRYTMSSFGEADPAPATPDPVAIQARTKQHRWDQSDVGVGEHDKVEMMAKPTYDGGWPSRQYYPATVQQNSWEMNTLRS